MNNKFGVTELKEVVSELEKEYEHCQTCWPTTVFSQGSFTERKVYCCSKFVKADGGQKMISPEEDIGLFSGIRFVLAGFEPAYENQYIEELEENGGINVGTYDSSCTHVIVSNLAYGDPICAAARKEGKALVTDAWVADCLDNDALVDVNNILYRPLKDLDGIPGSEDLCICLTGYQGQARQKIMRMVELIGARFTKPLMGNLVTHLICYKFEGEKYELAKKTGLKLINHFWLEDCLKLWSLLPEADYSRSGWEVENEAKQPEITKEKAKAPSTPASQKQVKKKTSISAEVPSPCTQEASTRRRDSSNFDNRDSRSPSAKVKSCIKSPVPSPSSVRTKTGDQTQLDTSYGEPTVKEVAQRKLAPSRVISLMEGVECSNGIQVSEIFHDVPRIADQQDFTSPMRVKNRRSSCGGANQVSPGTPGFREVAVAADQFATIDCGIEQMSICADSASKRRGIGVEKTTLNTTENGIDFESPESKRRRSLNLSTSGLPPSATKDRSGREQVVPSNSPVTKQVSSPNAAFVSSKSKTKRKLSKADKEVQQETVRSFGVPEALRNEDAMDLEISESSEFGTSPDNNLLARGSKLQAVQSKVCGAPNDPLYLHTDDGSSRPADTTSSKEASRTIQSSPPKSPRVVERDVAMVDADQIPHSVRKPKKAGPDAKSGPAARPVRNGLVKESLEKESRVTHSSPDASWKLVDNESSPVAGEQVLLQSLDGEAPEHDIPLESVDMEQSPKKRSKCSPPVAHHKSPQKSAGFVYSDQDNEQSPNGIKRGASLGSSPAEQLTSAATKVPFPRPKKGHKSSKKDADLASPGEKDEENTNEGSRRKDHQLRSSSPEMFTTTEAQATLSPQEKRSKKKSKGSCHIISDEQDKENVGLQRGKDLNSCKAVARKDASKKGAAVSVLGTAPLDKQKYFAVGGTSDQRNNLHYHIKLLGGKVCKSRYAWKDDVTHVVLPVPLRRTEKLLAGAAAGRWILKPEYVEASKNAAKFVDEEEYEWFGEGTNDKGTISLEAPRKWRTQVATTGCGAFYGVRVLLYGESTSPPSDTLKRAIRAGGGFATATSPPYSQHLLDGVDFVIINPVLVSKDDEHVQEFLKHKVACVTSDYFVDYICHPSSSLERHILYKTNSAVAVAHERLQKNIAQGPTEEVEKLRRAAAQKLCTPHPKSVQVADDIACVVCGRTDDEKVMLLCGDGKGRGCGLATHIHCCSPPLPDVPEEDWFCRNCEDL